MIHSPRGTGIALARYASAYVAATNYDDMRAAGVAAYKRIAATASPELAIVFREITGA